MCSEGISFLATDEFYAGTLHILTAIEVPVHLFGAYIIVAKTPKKMRTVKSSMLLLHFVGAFVDVYLSFIATPVLTLPVCSGYPLGFSLVLGIPTNVQVYLGISFVGGEAAQLTDSKFSVSVISVTILTFFEDRYHRLTHGHGSNGKRSWKRIIYVVIHYIVSVLFIAPGYLNIPDQAVGRAVTKKTIPCIPDDVLTRPGYFVLSVVNIIPCLCLVFMFSLVMPQTIYFVGAIFYYLLHTVSKSQTTNRLQKQFFFALCIQIFVPIVVLMFPVLYIVLAIWFDYYNQGATNIALAGIAFHGILSTITMLIVHTPYRNTTLSMFRLSPKNTGNNSQQIWKTVVGAHVTQHSVW
ncbi:Protein CBR-SRH-184 [Caenorhabditis briggsae]|uniref:Protein CBR-SRH-184 n=1 Tax=Caenorhabditis briggsae TaxID=6238 RepID=A8X8F9_CAEBR|nr:Protein CBR-SRH-184 [Caenorhabditis briggsae]CAP28920.2 Protein CBR-SRH-184 [Caenorhabditis briggsae]